MTDNRDNREPAPSRWKGYAFRPRDLAANPPSLRAEKAGKIFANAKKSVATGVRGFIRFSYRNR